MDGWIFNFISSRLNQKVIISRDTRYMFWELTRRRVIDLSAKQLKSRDRGRVPMIGLRDPPMDPPPLHPIRAVHSHLAEKSLSEDPQINYVSVWCVGMDGWILNLV